MPERTEHNAAPVDDLERLLRAGGRRDTADPVRRQQAHDAVRDAWQDMVRARTRRRWIAAGGSGLAAAAALAIAVALWPSPAPPPAAAAALARVAVVTGTVRTTDATSTRPLAIGDTIDDGAIVETAAGAVATFALEGGGELRQNGDSAVRWIATRHVALDHGQIYVVSGGGLTPVVVSTFAGSVRDIGTRFDVLVRAGQLRVRVREGAVRLESASGHRDASAGRELLAADGGEVLDHPVDTYGTDWDWILRATPFRLEGATLARFLVWVESEGGRQVEFRPPHVRDDVGRVVLHGTIEGLSIDQALEAVLPAAGLTHRLEGGRVVIQRPGTGARP